MTFDTDRFNQANDAAHAVALTTIGQGRRYRQRSINHLMALPDEVREEALALLMDWGTFMSDTLTDRAKQPVDGPQTVPDQDDGHE